MKVVLAIVAEPTPEYMNQAKLCMHSFRKNSGISAEILLVTNQYPPTMGDVEFMKKHFSPIKFATPQHRPWIGSRCRPANKLSLFEPLSEMDYDLCLYMDCDTVTLKPLPDLFAGLLGNGFDFVCRRGGGTDRKAFIDYERTLEEFGLEGPCMVSHDLRPERPMFNTGVFAFRSAVADGLGESAKRLCALLLKERGHIGNLWMAEQCAIALACVKKRLRVRYLEEKYNSWGNMADMRVLHCFKSRYKYNRSKMFETFPKWRDEYSKIDGGRELVVAVEDYLVDTSSPVT